MINGVYTQSNDDDDEVVISVIFTKKQRGVVKSGEVTQTDKGAYYNKVGHLTDFKCTNIRLVLERLAKC